MRHGWGYIYELPPICSRFEELANHFALDGISLADPGTGRVIRLSSVGEQISSSRQDILNECRKSHNVSFNLYLAASDNLFCSIEKLNSETVRESYSFDGKTQHESERIIKNLTELFCERAESRTSLGFVVDEDAELRRDFHWDDFFLGSATPTEWPMLIGLSADFAKLTIIPNRLYVREMANNHVLFRRITQT